MPLLESIHSPQDLKKLTLPQLTALAAEVRGFMVKSVAVTGGHLASSLGAVDLTVALYRVFSPPVDKIIWDVGHQAYAHKILTGRRRRFVRLRQWGGLSGFPNRAESPYDILTCGHSSTSISAGLGLARGRDRQHRKHRVVAVIGDGSLSNGLALEGLNDAGRSRSDLLVILNDNTMSISAPVGGLSNYLNRIITGTLYNAWKPRFENLIKSIPGVGAAALKLANFLEEAAKGLVAPGMLFEELGFRYFGPVNGHDLGELIPTLERVRNLAGPILLHVQTQKGKGYAPAEKNPVGFHGTPAFDSVSGERQGGGGFTFSQAFAQALLPAARRNPKVVAVVAAMTAGTALEEFAKQLPAQFFDVGIAEGHAVTMAGGLAASGMRPVVAVYSTFLQRAYDQIFHDVCLQNLPVVFAVDRAGLVGEDGPTHHGVFDLAYLRHLPNMTVLAPSSAGDLAGMLRWALRAPGPVALRYPRGLAAPGTPPAGRSVILPGRARLLRKGQDLAILALGPLVGAAMEAAARLRALKIDVAVVDARSVKPLDEALIRRLASSTRALLTVEDHALAGGFGSAVLEFLESAGLLVGVAVVRLGLPDRFVEQGSIAQLQAKYGLTAAGIEKSAQALLRLKKQPAAGARTHP
jgi:1-deoxy-D-xylulose-5-phosphate synthase